MEDLRRRVPEKKEPESKPDSETDHVSYSTYRHTIQIFIIMSYSCCIFVDIVVCLSN